VPSHTLVKCVRFYFRPKLLHLLTNFDCSPLKTVINAAILFFFFFCGKFASKNAGEFISGNNSMSVGCRDGDASMHRFVFYSVAGAGLPDFSWFNIPKRNKIYPMAKNTPNGYKIHQMTVK
jgi:hypothetical protein